MLDFWIDRNRKKVDSKNFDKKERKERKDEIKHALYSDNINDMKI